MRRELGRKYRCVQLYKSYLDNFRINTVDPRVAGKERMKIELKRFQIGKRSELHEKLIAATEEFSKRGEHQAIVFSSPTGSGKTITIAGLWKTYSRARKIFLRDRRCAFSGFLILQELNAQSRNKLINACDAPSEVGDFELINSDEFKEEFFTRAESISSTRSCLVKTSYLLRQEATRTALLSGRRSQTLCAIMARICCSSSTKPIRAWALAQGSETRAYRSCVRIHSRVARGSTAASSVSPRHECDDSAIRCFSKRGATRTNGAQGYLSAPKRCGVAAC